MNAKINEAIQNYSEIGWGGTIPADQLEAVHEFVISRLAASQDITVTEAIKLVHLLEGGNWAKGWETGYGSAQHHYAPRFVLNGGQS
jgi:hypothetical protein